MLNQQRSPKFFQFNLVTFGDMSWHDLIKPIHRGTGNTFLQTFVTLWDAQNRSNKCNSYAKGFPRDGIQSCKYDNGLVYPCFLTGGMESSKKAQFSQVHRNT